MKRLGLLGSIVLFILATGMLLSGCSNNSVNNTNGTKTGEKKIIKIGASSEAMPLVQSGVAPLESMGYKVEVVAFDDFFVPNVSLNEGSIDANFYQHRPFLNNYNQKNGTNIVMLIPLYNYSNNIYSRKFDSIENIPKGSKIGIGNDAANIDKHLRLLQKAGLITLTQAVKDLYTIADIKDNPKNLNLVQLDYKQRIAAMDELGGIVCGSTNLFMAGIDPTKSIIYKEVDNNYALGLCINGNTASANDKWVKDMIAAYTSGDADKYVQDYFKGAYIRSDEFEKLIKK